MTILVKSLNRVILAASLLSIYAFLFATGTLAQETYYIQNCRGLVQQARGNPATVLSTKWHVRLYKLGAATGGSDNWGLITGKSAQAVMESLKKSQDFQKRYAKWSGFDYRTEVTTYFNPLGPIAVEECGQKPSSTRVTSKIGEGVEAVNRLREGYERISQILSETPRENNPFSNVGRVLKDYGNSLLLAETKLAELQGSIDSIYGTAANIDMALESFSKDLAQAESNAKIVNHAISRTQTGSNSQGWRIQQLAYTETDGNGSESSEKYKQEIETSNGIMRVNIDYTSESKKYSFARVIQTISVPLKALRPDSFQTTEMDSTPSTWTLSIAVQNNMLLDEPPSELIDESTQYGYDGEVVFPTRNNRARGLSLTFGNKLAAEQAMAELRSLIRNAGAPSTPNGGRTANAVSTDRKPQSAVSGAQKIDATKENSDSTPLSITKDQLKAAQAILKKESAYRGAITGADNTSTREAIKRYQKKNGLKETGVLDVPSLLAMNIDVTGKQLDSVANESLPSPIVGTATQRTIDTPVVPAPDATLKSIMEGLTKMINAKSLMYNRDGGLSSKRLVLGYDKCTLNVKSVHFNRNGQEESNSQIVFDLKYLQKIDVSKDAGQRYIVMLRTQGEHIEVIGTDGRNLTDFELLVFEDKSSDNEETAGRVAAAFESLKTICNKRPQ